MAPPERYDIFISYAREDSAWVREHLHAPLQRCTTAQGTTPRIFLDDSPEGIRQGASFIEALCDALQNSDRVIPVYSGIYFRKSMCQWELKKAFQLDPGGQASMINPVLIDPTAARDVPFHVDDIQYLDVGKSDWFIRLTANLGLRPPPAVPQFSLVFAQVPGSVAVNHTLPPVLVHALDVRGVPCGDLEIELEAELGSLQGTSPVRCVGGVASFRDLSFGISLPATRLIARAEGCAPAYSMPFSVTPPQETYVAPGPAAADAAEEEGPVELRGPGDVVFFSGGSSVAVLGYQGPTVYDTGGAVLLDLPPLPRPRLRSQEGELLAIAHWSGEVTLVRADGAWRGCPTRDPAAQAYRVPGGMSIHRDVVYVGFWDGEVLRLDMNNPPARVMQHAAGVQALAATDEFLAVVDLEGMLTIHAPGGRVLQQELEPTVLGLSRFPGGLIAVGEDKLYQYLHARGTVLSEEPRLAGLADTLPIEGGVIILDAEGQGRIVDLELATTTRFWTSPGSRLSSATRDGALVVIQHPDSAWSLMSEGRIVYSQPAAGMSVKDDGGILAVGAGDHISLLHHPFLDKLIEPHHHD